MKKKLYKKIVIGLIASTFILPVGLATNHISNNLVMPTGVATPHPEL
ncbi:hypothetical protein [Clostridium manihotivorum]|nr:hypothetical protein [Clostridium manihotivorum]